MLYYLVFSHMKQTQHPIRHSITRPGFSPLDIVLTLVVTAVIAFGALTLLNRKSEQLSGTNNLQEAEKLVEEYLTHGTIHSAAEKEERESGIIAHWSFDDGEGSSITDSSGNGHTGTLTNMDGEEVWAESTAPDSPPDTYALSFDGQDDVIRIADTVDLQDLPSLTVILWIRPQSDSSYLLSKRDTCDGPWRLALDSNEQTIGFFKQTDDTVLQVQSESETVTLDAWNHIAFTWDGTLNAEEGVKFYVDGEETSYRIRQNGTGSPLSDAGCDLRIGARVGPTEVFHGLMDDMRIYNRVLSKEQIRKMMGVAVEAEAEADTAVEFETETEETIKETIIDIPLGASVLNQPSDEPPNTSTTINIKIQLELIGGEVKSVSVD
jgi:hypothetical protein